MHYVPDEHDEIFGDAMSVGDPSFVEHIHYEAHDAATAAIPPDGNGPAGYRRAWIAAARRLVAERWATRPPTQTPGAHFGRDLQQVLMAVRIDAIIDAAGKPGKRIIEGEQLSPDHPVCQTYVGHDTPEHSLVRNPVTYPPPTVEGSGRPCGCGCGREVFAGEVGRGHDQTGLHQRVAQIGSITEFLA